MIKNSLLSLGIVFIIALFSSCDNNRFFEKNKELVNETWNYKNKLVFDVDVKDTLSSYHFFLNLRNRKSYPYSNFYFFFHSVSPNGHAIKDTIHCVLANPAGKWLGSGAGNIIDNRILFKNNVRFAKSGKYHFEVEQAMREEDLPFILDAGLRIEFAGK